MRKYNTVCSDPNPTLLYPPGQEPKSTWRFKLKCWLQRWVFVSVIGLASVQAQLISLPLSNQPPVGNYTATAYPYAKMFLTPVLATAPTGSIQVSLNQPFVVKVADLATGRVVLVAADGTFPCVVGHSLRFGVYSTKPITAISIVVNFY
jgi:hypothetical protein